MKHLETISSILQLQKYDVQTQDNSIRFYSKLYNNSETNCLFEVDYIMSDDEQLICIVLTYENSNTDHTYNQHSIVDVDMSSDEMSTLIQKHVDIYHTHYSVFES